MLVDPDIPPCCWHNKGAPFSSSWGTEKRHPFMQQPGLGAPCEKSLVKG